MRALKRFYTAANLQEAHLLLDLLEQEGIEGRVLNANAQGGLGELPFTQTYPEIWLEDERDVRLADAVVSRYERAGAAGLVCCRNCGESNPGNFEVCWNCSSVLE